MRTNYARRLFEEITFLLDDEVTIADSRHGSLVDFPFKGIWIVDGSDDAIISARFNYPEDQGSSLEMPLNMRQNFPEQVANAKFHWKAQAGKWVKIKFAIETTFDSEVSLNKSSGVSIVGGTNYTDGNFEVTAAPDLILAASVFRQRAVIHNRSAEVLFVGTVATLNDLDYQKKAQVITPNARLVWDNSAGLYARTEVNTTDEIAILEELK